MKMVRRFGFLPCSCDLLIRVLRPRVEIEIPYGAMPPDPDDGDSQ